MIDRAYFINKTFTTLCKAELRKNSSVYKYVSSRIDPKIMSAFNIGFCTADIISKIQEIGFDTNILDQLGLIAMNKDGEYYPVFLNRIVIPIFTERGIAGFSGRCFYQSQQKYINTKKTLLYNKSDLLYPLAYSKKHMYSNYCILVEGYFDALALIASGIRNVVALCGTALSKNQINLIRRWTDTVKILLDGDEAGQLAARRIHTSLLESRMNSSIITLPTGFDPDTFIAEHGSNSLKTLLEEN